VEPRENESVVRGDVTSNVPSIEDDVDSIVHLAAQTSVGDAIKDPITTWDVNATGTRNVLEAVRETDARFFYASTASVYGPPEYLPVDESHPLGAVEPYGASKLAGDRLVRAYHRTYGLDTVTARVFNTFGPGQPEHNVVPAILNQALDGGPVELGNLSPSRDFLYIEDVVDAVDAVLTLGESGDVYNIGSGTDLSIGDLVELAVDLIDSNLEVVSTTDKQRSDDVEIPRHVADVSTLTDLGWSQSYTVKEGLERTLSARSE
jgi:UDP-glucose 4-epimerase